MPNNTLQEVFSIFNLYNLFYFLGLEVTTEKYTTLLSMVKLFKGSSWLSQSTSTYYINEKHILHTTAIY